MARVRNARVHSWQGASRLRQPIGATASLPGSSSGGVRRQVYVTRLTRHTFLIVADVRADVDAAGRRVSLLVRMPGDLKRALSDEVRRSGRSLNDVAVGILASRFAVPFEPSGRAGKAPGEGGAVLLRMPAELKDKLAARATQRRRNVNDLIVETLGERLGKEHMASTNGKALRNGDKVRVA